MLSSISRSAAGRAVSVRYATSFARSLSSRTATKPRFGARGLYGQFPKAIRGFASAALSKKAAPAKKPVKATTKKPTKAATKPVKANAKVKAKPKTKATAKAKPRAKAKAKKPAAKPKRAKRAKRVISPEKQVVLERQRLKKAALYDEPKQFPASPWLAFLVQETQGKSEGGVIQKMPAIAQAFKALSPQELQRLDSVVEQNKLKNAATYKAWVESHPPQTIYDANLARKLLKRKHAFPKGNLRLIRDDRLPKHPGNAFSMFTKARWASGDYSVNNEPIRAIASKIGSEWKGLSVAERQPYEDLAKSEAERYGKTAGSVIHSRQRAAGKA
jgi:hypothetical protein